MAANGAEEEELNREERDRNERIRERAYRLWLEEGCPEGRADDHWDKASELVAIEESYKDTLKPNPTEAYENSPTGEPVEPLEAVQNLGEFPTLVDQGEEAVFPDRGLAAEADEAPMKPGRKGAARASSRKMKK